MGATGDARGVRYATALIDVFTTTAGERVTLRPVLPQDLPLLEVFYRGLSRTSLQRRFHCAFASLSDERVRELTRQALSFDPDRLVLVCTTLRDGCEVIVAQAGWVVITAAAAGPALVGDADADEPSSAEFAVVVADEAQHQGIGRRLMHQLMLGAHARGLSWLRASVVDGNQAMFDLMHRCGFWCSTEADEEGVREVTASVSAWVDHHAASVARRRFPGWRWPTSLRALSGRKNHER